MVEFVTQHEPLLRLSAFLATLIAMACWEGAAPRRPRMLSRVVRWPTNIGIVGINTALVRFLFPAAAVGGALWASKAQFGLFHWVTLPHWAAIALSVIFLDLLIYGQHVVFHKAPLLWRLHRVHHIDRDVDFTTGLRFHPVEIILSAGIKFAAVITLGAPAAAVILFEVILNSSALFNHGNVQLKSPLDGILRTIIVTPDMHRVHHSVRPVETNSNYGFALSIWDRLFGTYLQSPARGHHAMTLGLPTFRTPGEAKLMSLLLNPLR
ncbi:MAG: sterol desaturase family protein [Gammaproteobacteria bacterium]